MNNEITITLPTGGDDSFEDLLRKAAAAHGKPKNVEKWARQLGEETGNIND